MDSFFEMLPNEINWYILNYLTNPSDLLKVGHIPGLSERLSWEFWRKKAFQIWEVPDWYFDLPIQQKRQIRGDERFLEITAQFEVISESVARIEDGIVKGVLPFDSARHLAKHRGNLQMIGPLGLKEEEVVCCGQLNRFGLSPILNLEFLGGTPEKEFLKDTQEIIAHIEEGRTKEVEEKYLRKKPFQTMASFAVLGYEKTCNWIVGRFGFATPKQQLAVTYFSMLSGNFPLFEELISNSKLSENEKQILLKKAYYLAKRPYITFLENQGVQINIADKIRQLDQGFVSIPHPVEVYSILQELLSNESINRKEIFTNHLENFIDFFLLLKNLHSSEDLLREMERSIWWNGSTVQSVRHCVSVLKEQEKLKTFEPSFSLSNCGIQQAIFRNLESRHRR